MRWAYSEQDPLKEPADLSQLPPMSRSGSRSLHLFESTHTFNQKTADALQWMVQSNSVKLPAKHTLYWCTMLKLPEMPGKHHMIGYRPNIAEANRRYVHHMMLYECHDEVCILPFFQNFSFSKMGSNFDDSDLNNFTWYQKLFEDVHWDMKTYWIITDSLCNPTNIITLLFRF